MQDIFFVTWKELNNATVYVSADEDVSFEYY
jgi:hypothetical protein